MKCKECGTDLPCVAKSKAHICCECDEQFYYCYKKCENPCRKKEEQERLWDKWKPEWRDIIDAIDGRDEAENQYWKQFKHTIE